MCLIMRKGKRFIENENLIIYVGTAIFLILAISVGIVMYMTTKTDSNNENSLEKMAEEGQNEVVENVNSSIGKTIEEQQEEIIIKTENTIKESETTNKTESTKTKTEETKKDNSNKTEEVKQNTVVKEEVTTQNSNQENDSNKTENKDSENKPNEKVEEENSTITFVKPTEGEIISEFAQENLIYSETLKEWITHPGIDIKADKTSVIKASADGIISSIVNDPRYGLTVVITHSEGYETVYSNLLTAEFVVEGEEVKQGQTIGTVGNTASFESNMEPHLHFEILQNGNYLDPNIYLK